MKRYLQLGAIILFLLFVSGVWHSEVTVAQSGPGGPAAGQPPIDFPSGLHMQCQGCHGPGKTLPNLAGEKFHKDTHASLESSIHNKLRPDGTPIASCKTCHTVKGDMTTILPPSDPRSTINRANIAETCGQCHADQQRMQGTGISNRPMLSYRESVHAKAIARGNLAAAVCTDCHTSHNVQPASNVASSINKANIPATCGKCHSNEATEFTQSVHGLAVARGVSRSPACTDCHGIHDIQLPFDQKTAAPSTAIATDTCSRCHEGVVLTKEFGVAAGRVTSYNDSYHGMASKMGSEVVANCASCHGVHNILPSSDPRSMINANNLTQTCSQCHLGAGDNFIKGKVHMVAGLVEEKRPDDPAILGTTIVRWIYLPLIFLTIGGMVLHNILVWRKKAARKLHSKRTVVRLTRPQRTQHWLLLGSFITLVISGFALQYPESWVTWLPGVATEMSRRTVHRIAAVVMILTGVYHVLYILFSREGRRWVIDMLPRPKDLADLFGNMMYYIGFRKERPKIARFGYAEKAEYWAVVWGTIIMGVTGLMIWYKIEIFGFLPRWWVEIAIAIHLYEAILATLAIVVWHFYSVIFDPDVYPISFAFWDGRVPEHEFKEEHELAWGAMQARDIVETDDEESSTTPGSKPLTGET